MTNTRQLSNRKSYNKPFLKGQEVQVYDCCGARIPRHVGTGIVVSLYDLSSSLYVVRFHNEALPRVVVVCRLL